MQWLRALAVLGTAALGGCLPGGGETDCARARERVERGAACVAADDGSPGCGDAVSFLHAQGFTDLDARAIHRVGLEEYVAAHRLGKVCSVLE